MGTILASAIVTEARYQANDEGSTKRWSDAEALVWTNAAQREIVNLIRSANVLRTTAVAGAGARQTLTGLGLTTGIQFMDIIANYDATGATPGRAITKVKRAWLDEREPYWRREQATEAEHWMADDDDPTAAFLYPAISGGGRIEVLYSAVPAALGALSSAIGLSDVYANAIRHYMLASFFAKDITSVKSMQLFQAHAMQFAQSLGVRVQSLAGTQVKGDARAAGAS